MRVGVVGASGYAGGELLRLLASHPHFKPDYYAAASNAGEFVATIHTHLTSYGTRKFDSLNAAALNELDLVFLALPHGESARLVNQLRSDLKIVDLGADFRLKDAKSWERYYGGDHAGTWNYGLPEIPNLRNSIQTSERVANPGCYATAIAIGIAPMAFNELVELEDVTVVAASGTTGAGRSTANSLSASEVMNSLKSYKFGGVHQHTPEVEETLSALSKKRVKISFTPILAPMPRGILATITVRYFGDYQSARDQYESAYANEPFIRLLPEGLLPETSSLIGSNSAHLQIAHDIHTSRLIVSIAIDNLGKGAAGQAIQNANLMCGFPESSGLAIMGIGQ